MHTCISACMINMSFYKSPKLCSNSAHIIDFLNVGDKYNPFSNINKYAECCVESKILYDNIIQFLIEYDIQNLSFKQYRNLFKPLIIVEISKAMANNNIVFNKSNPLKWMHTMFTKMSFDEFDKHIDLYIQCLGTSEPRQIVKLHSAFVVAMYINNEKIGKNKYFDLH